MRHGRLALVLALLALARGAGATITIQLGAQTSLDQEVGLTLTAGNSGDEAAHDVAPEVVYGGQVTRGDAIAALETGASHEWKLSLSAPPGPGTFPIVIRVAYADANGYPLSALLVHLVRTAGAPSGPVRPSLTAGTMGRYSNARLTLENPGPKVIAGRVVPALPAEFGTEPESIPAQVPAQGRVQVPFAVQNNGALPDSVYPIYAIFEYDLDGTHQAVVGDTTVKVVVETPGRRLPLLVGGIALAAAIVVFLFAWRRAARRRGAVARAGS